MNETNTERCAYRKYIESKNLSLDDLRNIAGLLEIKSAFDLDRQSLIDAIVAFHHHTKV